jgi:hypothetical protein
LPSIQSSIIDSFYQFQTNNVELIDIVCKSQSCKVDLNLSGSTSPELISNKILGSITQDVDYKIQENNGEMSIFIILIHCCPVKE